MVLRCWFSFLVTLNNVKGIFSASRGESHCAVRDDQGTCRQSEDAEELVALQAKMVSWCGKEAMAAINSTEAIEALVAELGLPNTTCTEEGGSRDGGGSPFTRGPPDNDCYYWDPTKPASDIDCDDVSFNKRTPLCGTGCSMASFAIARPFLLLGCIGSPGIHGSFRQAEVQGRLVGLAIGHDPTGPWFSADRDQTCNDLCTAKNYTECGKEEMAAINSSVALADLLSILNLTCTPPSDPSNRKRNGAGSPFTRGPPEANDCYYWDPIETASNIDCISPVAFPGRRPLCYCK
ncbi:TBC1D13 [Symbiodinium necroappetens]|uniref:TBC1D13 protein n=1 Tax=Symbiodinium necroappetens TaxID=1628268 RepID=A0A812MWR1_9DINO|nr:TBC1D13 [Symbiodinium necroappetens]